MSRKLCTYNYTYIYMLFKGIKIKGSFPLKFQNHRFDDFIKRYFTDLKGLARPGTLAKVRSFNIEQI